MKGKDLGECYLKVHLPQSFTVLSLSSKKLLWGNVLSEEVLSQYIAHHHPQLFTGVLGRIGCTKEYEFRNNKRRDLEFNQEKEKD